MNSQLGFIIFFAVLAFITSISSGFYVGNRFGHILFVASIGVLFFCALGLGVYRVLQDKVPEVLDVFSNLGSGASSEEQELNEFVGGEGGEYSQNLDGGSMPMADEKPVVRKKNDKFGDHLIIDNIEIKNEPKLMAEAIRTMLARDEDS